MRSYIDLVQRLYENDAIDRGELLFKQYSREIKIRPDPFMINLLTHIKDILFDEWIIMEFPVDSPLFFNIAIKHATGHFTEVHFRTKSRSGITYDEDTYYEFLKVFSQQLLIDDRRFFRHFRAYDRDNDIVLDFQTFQDFSRMLNSYLPLNYIPHYMEIRDWLRKAYL